MLRGGVLQDAANAKKPPFQMKKTLWTVLCHLLATSALVCSAQQQHLKIALAGVEATPVLAKKYPASGEANAGGAGQTQPAASLPGIWNSPGPQTGAGRRAFPWTLIVSKAADGTMRAEINVRSP